MLHANALVSGAAAYTGTCAASNRHRGMAADALVLPDTAAADWMPLDRHAFLHWLVCAGGSRGDVLPAYARDPVSLTSTGIHACELASARGCTMVAFNGRGSHSAAAARMALDVLQRNPFGLPCPQTPVVCIIYVAGVTAFDLLPQ